MIYILLVLGVLLGVSTLVTKCEHERANAAETKAAALVGQLEAAKKTGEAANAREREKEEKLKEINDANVAALADQRAAYELRLRHPRTLLRPGGSEIRTVTCPGPVADATAGKPVPDPAEYVPKADYVALEERAGRDVMKVLGLQKYVETIVKACWEPG